MRFVPVSGGLHKPQFNLAGLAPFFLLPLKIKLAKQFHKNLTKVEQKQKKWQKTRKILGKKQIFNNFG